ncbi:hypothetical protein BKA64DRAFT_215772 [Cadophora sp. MPI-SDFR-AT-0126]|nr:hypothetical protein BKA64DRAFT_215772 [Leotiomycetes sp. MPI-SDFR-AT-0126]
MASDGIPVVLFGKLPLVTTPQTEALLPEVDAIHLIESLTTARLELPLLLSTSSSATSSQPRPIKPASQKGSNIHRPSSQQRRPLAVIAGGGFTPKEFEELRKLEGAETVPWLRADNSLVPESEWPPNPVVCTYISYPSCFWLFKIVQFKMCPERSLVLCEKGF